MTIGRRLTLGFLCIALMAAVLTTYNLHLSREIGQLRWVELPMEHIIGQVEESQWEGVFAVSSAAFTLDPMHAEIFERTSQRIQQDLARYRELIDTDAERIAAAELEERWALLEDTGRRILLLAERKKHAQDAFFEHVDQADDIIDTEIQARFVPTDPELLQKERLIREVEVSIWEAIHAAQQYTSLNDRITRAGHAQNTFAELMEKQLSDVEDFWTPYRELVSTAEERGAAALFDQLWAQAIQDGRSVVSLHDEIKRELSELYELAESGDAIIDDKIFTSIAARVAARDEAAHFGQILTIALGSGAIIGSVVIGGVITRSVCQPIERLRQATTEVARGHLDHRIDSQSLDEIGVVSRAFDGMTEELSHSTMLLNAEILERNAAEKSLRDVNENLSETTEQLMRVNSNLQDFVYIASHDLREPLRKISSFGELLNQSLGGKLSEDDQENLEFMVDGASRMTQMVEGLLAYSRLNNKAAEPEPIDLNEVLRGLKSLELAAMLEEAGGEIQVPGDLPMIAGTPSEIRQLLQNVFANALKYRRDGAIPRIIVAAASDRDGMARVSVIDNGIGIPSEHRDSVFKMFRRLHARDEYPGAGIGLAVCRKIVEKHGGTIGIEANDHLGSTVWFTLPCHNEQDPPTAISAYTKPGTAPRTRTIA